MKCTYCGSNCRKAMVTGSYDESTARGMAITTAKELFGASCSCGTLKLMKIEPYTLNVLSVERKDRN